MPYFACTVRSHHKTVNAARSDEATPQTILALVLPAMLTSARILHLLAHGGVKGLLEAGYHTLEQMKQRT